LKCHTFTLGRSPKCDVIFKASVRVSNTHCIIFCKPNIAMPYKDGTGFYFDLWIEDLSANGTFVNDHRLVKNVPRQLHHGDVVSLVNPEVYAANMATDDEMQSSSFVVIVYLPDYMKLLSMRPELLEIEQPFDEDALQLIEYNRSSEGSNADTSSAQASSSSSSAALTRTSSVMSMLNKGRNIQDFYAIRQKLGDGAAGAVHHCISKDTGKSWAVKVVNVKRGQSASAYKTTITELIREAEFLRSLRHPKIVHLEDIFADQFCVYLVMELANGNLLELRL
jgi:pSer/pThr/pTyr-binding forkhead associated (FHA) protein